MYCGHKHLRNPKYLQQNSVLCDFTTFDYSWFGSWQVLVLPISFLLIMVLLHVGMGDIKILALMLVTHVNSAISIVPCVFLFATIHIMMVFLVRGRFPLKIPLAPSIFLGFATYLATT